MAVYGAYFKLQSFIFMPIIGINTAIIPIIGYNYGAGKKERIYRTVRYGLLYGMAIGLLGFSAFQLLPRTLLGFFASENMLRIGIPALRIISIIFLAAGFCVVSGSICQALDKSMAAFIVSIFRQLVGLVPAAWLLSRLGDVNYVWWAFPFAEIFSALFSFIYLRKALRDMENKLSLREAP